MTRTIIAITIPVTLILLFVLLAVPTALEGSDRYKGKVVFDSKSEYQNFKQEIIASNSDWSKMEVLSSEPPIIVDFSLKVEKDYPFPYGERSDNRTFNIMLSSVILALLILGFEALIWSP